MFRRTSRVEAVEISPRQPCLTPTELRILHVLADGTTYAGAAEQLGMSEATVKRRLRTIQQKLQVTNKTQTIVAAVRRGLI